MTNVCFSSPKAGSGVRIRVKGIFRKILGWWWGNKKKNKNPSEMWRVRLEGKDACQAQSHAKLHGDALILTRQ